jgi:hypothetical protein
MMKLKLIGAAALLSAACAAPVMAQEATQEPGTIGFNYPNSHYMTGGYGVHLPYNTGRYPRLRGDYPMSARAMWCPATRPASASAWVRSA